MFVVVSVPVFVDHVVVPVAMAVPLGDEEDRAEDHDGQGRPKRGTGRFPK